MKISNKNNLEKHVFNRKLIKIILLDVNKVHYQLDTIMITISLIERLNLIIIMLKK